MRHRNFLVAVTAGHEPTSFKKAVWHHCWRQAMQNEIVALENNGTWTMEKLLPVKKALGSKWIYKTKYHSDGTVERLKRDWLHLVIIKWMGSITMKLFASVVKMVTVRAFLAIAAFKN